MAQRTVLIWNIQTFGRPVYGASQDTIRANYIDILAKATNADVIIIQEFMKGGQPQLAQIMPLLGANWYFDWIPGSISSHLGWPNRQGNPFMEKNRLYFNDLDFMHHSEGYAVLFRYNTLEGFQPGCSEQSQPFSEALAHPHARGTQKPGYISLCAFGLPPVLKLHHEPPLQANVTDRYQPALFPIQPCKTPSKSDIHPTAELQHLLGLYGMRHPCWVKVRGANTTVPIVVYHAPVEPNFGSVLGTCSCGLLTQVQGIPQNTPQIPQFPHLVVGGDFNVVSYNLDDAFLNFTNCNMYPGTRVGMTPIKQHNHGYCSSMVHYAHGVSNEGPLYASQNLDDFYQRPRDQIFYRFNDTTLPNQPKVTLGQPNPFVQSPNQQQNQFSGVIDVLRAHINNTGGIQDSIRNNRAIRGSLEHILNNGLLPQNVQGDPNLVAALGELINNQPGPGGPAPIAPQTAATFYRLFISDHAPLLISFDA